MPDAIAELQAYVNGSSGSAVDDLRAYLAAPTTRPTSAAPTEDELAVIRGAPPDRPPTGLTPESIPSPEGFEGQHPIDAAFRRAVTSAGTPIAETQGRAPARLGSAKTGGGATAIPGTFPVLDEMAAGPPQLARGARNLLRAGIVAASPDQPAWGAPARPAFGATPPEGGAMGAASDVIEGAMKTGTPLMIAGAVTAPVATAVGLGAGMVGQAATARGAQALGLSPEAQRLAGNVGGLVAGAAGGAAAHVGAPSLMDALRQGRTADSDVARPGSWRGDETAARECGAAPTRRARSADADAPLPAATVRRTAADRRRPPHIAAGRRKSRGVTY